MTDSETRKPMRSSSYSAVYTIHLWPASHFLDSARTATKMDLRLIILLSSCLRSRIQLSYPGSFPLFLVASLCFLLPLFSLLLPRPWY